MNLWIYMVMVVRIIMGNKEKKKKRNGDLILCGFLYAHLLQGASRHHWHNLLYR